MKKIFLESSVGKIHDVCLPYDGECKNKYGEKMIHFLDGLASASSEL